MLVVCSLRGSGMHASRGTFSFPCLDFFFLTASSLAGWSPLPSRARRQLRTMAAADHAETRKLIEFAAKAAETFVSAYYSASDSPHRVQVSHYCDGGKLHMGVGQSADPTPALPACQLIPTLYLPESTIVWNGHPISGSSNLATLLNSMPGSKHEVQTFDCHPLGGGTESGECALVRPAPQPAPLVRLSARCMRRAYVPLVELRHKPSTGRNATRWKRG